MKGRHSFSGMIYNIDILEYIQFLIMIEARTILELRLRRGPTDVCLESERIKRYNYWI